MEIREISGETIAAAVERLFLRANTVLPQDMKESLLNARGGETAENAVEILNVLVENYEYAEKSNTPICQDTGMAVVFLEIGSDVHITGMLPEEAVNEGVRRAYVNGYFRKSVVVDPLRRTPGHDNTPAVVHISIVRGDRVKITAMPKGFGSENMSALRMFNPSVAKEEIEDFVAGVVKDAGGRPCPPVVVGVGIGGTAEKACLLAKRALAREAGSANGDPLYAEMERRILEKINATGVGPQGMGGRTTALSVSIEPFATHIAGLPVAVNLCCHVNRHASEVL